METLVLIGIFIVLLSIFIPYLQSIRESSRRITCTRNLTIIRSALQNYARDNSWEFPRVRYDSQNNPNGYTAFTGADADNPFAPDSPVAPNDVTASLWLLVRIGYITDVGVFVCPSSSGRPDTLTDARGQPVSAAHRGNFRSPANLSYSYAMSFSGSPEYRLKPDFIPSGFALLADQNPGASAASEAWDAPMTALSVANSPNHGKAGQNVIYGDNTGDFRNTPYCGVGFSVTKGKTLATPGDNIFTARLASVATTHPTTLPLSVAGVVSTHVAPVRTDDSYLVPTADDLSPIPPPPSIRTTAPATTAAATSQAATTTSAPTTR